MLLSVLCNSANSQFLSNPSRLQQLELPSFTLEVYFLSSSCVHGIGTKVRNLGCTFPDLEQLVGHLGTALGERSNSRKVKTRRRRLPSGENTKEKAAVGGKCEGEGYRGENVKKKAAVGRGDAKKTIEENEKEKLPSGENVKEKNAK
ncbi:hypothetical protein ZIOFF_031554 [Zingiber officinale]|uniref:Uncharacterized protein n=1 Tax=Zingiber officinale TaxID=94328 RepID=A0A8J5GGS9_ZINOF|nr:hypothetical protein ZIOFF_031554 [Zingiber officinale]